MPSTPAPRIILEASEMHRAAPSSTKFESIEEINDSNLGPVELYARSKLAMILGVKYGLLERVIKPNGDNIYAIAVHPGAVSTLYLGKLILLADNDVHRSIPPCSSSGKKPIRG